MTRTRRCIIYLGVLVLALAATSCGGDDDDDASSASDTTTATSGPPATASEELCRERDALEDSIKNLGDVNVIENGTSALEPALDQVRDNLESLKETAGDDFRTEIDAFETSLSDLQDAIGNIDSNGVSSVAQAVADVGRSGSDLAESLGSMECD